MATELGTRRHVRSYVEPDNVPIPDPSLRTTEELRIGLSSLRELIEARLAGMDKAMVLYSDQANRQPTEVDKLINGVRGVFDVRLAGLEKSIDAIISDLHDLPNEVGTQVKNLREQQDEKFHSIQTQFAERDVRSTASEDAAKIAVNAALQAQKEAAAAQNQANSEAITKSEAATAKQIDAIQALITTNNKANDEKIGSVLTLIASNNKAIDEKIASINARLDRGDGSSTAHSTNQTTTLAVIGVLVAAIVGGFAVVHNSNAPAPIPVYQSPIH